MDKEYIDIPTDLLQIITSDQAWHYGIVPNKINGSYTDFYISAENNNSSINEELELLLGKNIRLSGIPGEVLAKTLSRYYKRSNGKTKRVAGISSPDNFLEEILSEAKMLDCSDVHVELYENGGRVRFRIDGKLFERFTIKKEAYPALSNKIKIMANLDIAEKRLPQDGRILYKSPEESTDIRVSVVPALYGEKIVLRLLNKSANEINIENIGFGKLQLKDYIKGVKKPHGIILISGPTGSGKTTTLYATLNLLNSREVNILTIEDPIEYTLEGVNQVQLRENIGLTFANALRTFLRQDPDIIMLGEIRDSETAQMAIRASLTGHLVLSTIHTNSAIGVITRLLDMGIPPFMLFSTLNTAVAQRLVRRLCNNCKKEEDFDITAYPEIAGKAEKYPKTHYLPQGCELCYDSGYSGRVAIFEVININNQIKDHFMRSGNTISDGNKFNIKSLSHSAYELFTNGITSLDEILPILLSQD